MLFRSFSFPLLRALVQTVAESDGDWNYLNLDAASGAWVGAGLEDYVASLDD